MSNLTEELKAELEMEASKLWNEEFPARGTDFLSFITGFKYGAQSDIAKKIHTQGYHHLILKLTETMCNKCANKSELMYFIEVNGLWQTKMNGLTANPNHEGIISSNIKSDIDTICEVLDTFLPIEGAKRTVTEHLFITDNNK